ncbi:cob(I)yrinic acid a,c-diamide adenosyltransferase [Aeromonas simiae]|uniref:cob(I)yrinic acid a,c-diamide adenosyltransferase n=1 Tax=Aeromonas simiae TaxID=218936 RepID=UPI00266DD102|nr:cob(I)yrinic acid a,c-diamide adenosyltransferase [Aeromonas simiae]MDO2948028.1 cob(I)yrinic acid a,c-diamide adenosyltransferase [Aeromonas simiae]MDO2952279.1 cob(I)yrinic acid a,c-diamide adenosyltransferase [Aeromonas simiae]MDO2955411.1 cob(I)yrinic acid a,c-diamide adenosyltransferase [Aeromonas simiae]
MRIYTRQGDQGQTRLADGSCLSKTHIRVESYGLVDELNSQIGLLIANLPENATVLSPMLQLIQQEMFDVGSELAFPCEAQNSALWQVSEIWTRRLEAEMDQFSETLPPLRQFILPGGSPAAAQAHVVRTLTRRCERQLVLLSQHEPLNPALLPYINRLSDWFFVLARVLLQREGKPEIVWRKASER